MIVMSGLKIFLIEQFFKIQKSSCPYKASYSNLPELKVANIVKHPRDYLSQVVSCSLLVTGRCLLVTGLLV